MLTRITVSGIFLILIFLFSETLRSAPLDFFPVELTQPDGRVINVFLTGDEYYNWVHDEDEYTIIQDQNTGYYVYADLADDELIPTGFIVGRVDAALTGLVRGLNISGEKMLERRNKFLADSPADMGDAPKTGIINNLVVYIRFSGEPEFTDTKVRYDTMFNNSTPGANSMYNYFKEASYNALSITSTFYPVTAGTTVISYQDSHVRGYFQPYSTTNTIGYSGDTERRLREHTLLVNAVNYVSSQVPAGLNLDGDNDGRVDNVVFVVYGSPGAWADLLWPHRWALYSYTVNINGKRVYDYNFQLQTSLFSSGVGVLCHEMFHSLGAPDLYHYTSNGITPVGAWDIMQSNQNPPQHMGAYMKYRYGNWISSIPVISTGTYFLNPLTSSSGNCYRINSPNSSTEYFVVEYRRKTGPFEGSLPGTGLLVYRINTAKDGQGNAQGPPDEVYIYRPNGTPTVNGLINNANYSSNVGRTLINDATNPSSFLSNGSPGGLYLHNVGSSDETIYFSVSTTAPPNPVTNLAVHSPTSGSLSLQWTVPSNGITEYDIRYSSAPINNMTKFYTASQLPYSGIPGTAGTTENYFVAGLSPGTLYYFSIRSANVPNNWSGLSNSPSGTTWTTPLIQVNPAFVTNTFSTGGVYTDTIRISNIKSSPSTLNYSITFENNSFPAGVVKSSDNLNRSPLNAAAVGIENTTGATGLVTYNSTNVSNRQAMKISDSPDWLSGNVSSGTIYSGNYIDLILTFTTTGLPIGDYTIDVVINSNDPQNSSVTVPVTMHLKNIVMLSSLKALIEGLYDGNKMTPDSITVELCSADSPFGVVDEIRILLDSSGTGSGIFTEAVEGSSYYIVVKHRNGIETWSASGQIITSGILNYDFTTSASKAFGNNLVQKGSRWCFYSGDINNDGFIDAADLNQAGIEAAYFFTGYLNTDVNGDLVIDLQDIAVIENNKNRAVTIMAP